MPQIRKPEKKEQIKEAAARLFRDKGYSATSMRDLAEAVSLKASSLYNHISSKEEILREICFENAHRFRSGMEEVEQAQSTAMAKVEALLRLHVRTAMEDATSVTAFNDEWRHLNEPFLSEFKSLRRDYEQRFRLILLAGMEEGEFRQMDPNIALYTLFSSVRWVYDWFQPGRPLTAANVEDELTAFILQALRP
ncbi:TetR/AcrR family transcriptional regulator [Phaeodactylibacter luteus]|uniref:TetR/AcrR family transcriptional regulator n=1 Tax=Phaeodactylibacter luteus TaxID=1564516 RepID=A0A5C6RYW7_9BACT|nr:TetR/AcrR family transcriptional regulator [Phaeodactylibacter luteus]TXB67588.1 TetR/AcrR family transcriptional regulator [Phaeodactylibacter luteus]